MPKQKLVVNSKTETPRAPVTARAPAEPSVLTPSGELRPVPGRPGNAASARIHAALLQRTTAAQPSSARQSLLQIQQQYGNRYVQRVLALARQGTGSVETTPEVEQSIRRARGDGQALDEGVRTQMESALGADFSAVRIHTDTQADTLNRSLQARAFTTGRDIFFRQGAYNPGSSSGRELIAHELTHVAQQNGGAVQPKLMVNAPGDRFEQEADQAARVVMQHEQQPTPAPSQTPLAQRQVEEEEEAVQARRVRRQAEDEDESLQMQPVQRQAEEDEESLQTQRVQRQDEGEEEPVQLRRLQRQAVEDEESIQPSLIQRQAAPAAEMAGEEAEPSEAEKAAALAAARAAEQIAAQARAEAANEVDKSRAAQAGEQQTGQAAQQEAQAKAPATPVEAAYAVAAQADGEAAQQGAGAAASNGAGLAAGGGARPMAPNGAGPGAVNGKAPTAPEEDADFQTVLERIKRVAAKQQAHAPATAKAAEAQAAAESPPAELESQAQATQVDEMEQVEPPAFDAAAFKAQLLERIAALAPRTAEEADNFKKENKLAGVKADMQGKVQDEQSASQAPLEEKTAEAPDTSQVEPKAVEPLPPSEPGPHPPEVGATATAPKAKGQSEVEAPLHENSGQLDQQMAEADTSEEQLEQSNEPEFETALASKREAQTHAQEAPQEYRQLEQEQLTEAETDAAAAAQDRTQAMHGDRAQLLGQVESQQGQAKGQDEQARAKIAADIEQIYEETKTNVETILSELDGKVEQAFDEGATAATQLFEEFVAAKMNAYKERRYGGWLGWARWAKDKLLGMPAEVNAFYAEGRQLYLQKMDAVIDNVVAIVGTGLSEAKAEIANGQQRIQAYVEQLPDDLKAVGQEAAENIQSKFDDLEQSVNDKQNELLDTLANKYQENLQAIDARIEEMKAANQGLVDKAINAVAGVIKTILKLKDMLLSVLAKIADVVVKIIKAPVKFLGNLVQGIRQGFDNFMGRIGQHLQTGLVAWLTGTLGSLSIRVPDDIFSLPGIFSLVVQVLGLTWDYIRSKAVKLLGEPVVKALETGFEIFQILMREGPLGLWQFVKEQFNDLKEMVIEQIKSMVITEVIKAGVKWVLGLLNPVGAFVKAAMAIYEIVKFFVERGSQVIEMVNAFIAAVAAIAGGAVGGAAKLVEDALAKALPVVIGFLASLLGISGLAKRVQGIIQRVRKRIDKAIDSLILRAKQFAKKLLRKQKPEKGGPDERTEREKQADLNTALVTAERALQEKDASPDTVRPKLPTIQSQYRLTALELKKDPDNKYYVEGKINPKDKTEKHALTGSSGSFRLAPGGFEAHEADIILTSRGEEKDIHLIERHGRSVTAAFLKSRLEEVLDLFYRVRQQKITDWESALAGAYARQGRELARPTPDAARLQQAGQEIELLQGKINSARRIRSNQRDEIMHFLQTEARRTDVPFRATKFYKVDIMRKTVMAALESNREKIDADFTDKDGMPKPVGTQAGPYRHQFAQNIGVGYELDQNMEVVDIPTLTKVAVLLIISDAQQRLYKVRTAYPEP